MNSTHPASRPPEKRTVSLCIVFLTAFVVLAVFRSSLHTVDIAVNLWMPTIQSGITTIFATGIDVVFDTNFLVVYSVAIAAVFFVKKRKAQGLLLVGAMAGDALLVYITKNIEQVARPANAILLNAGYSFPSGHSAGIVVLAGVLAYFAWCHWHSTRARAGFAGVYVAVVGVVSFDRVYLNTHWFSDVLGALMLGAFWLLFVVLLFGRLECRGSFEGVRFGQVANWLYLGALVLAILVIVSGALV